MPHNQQPNIPLDPAMIPPDVKNIRALSLAVLTQGPGKELLDALKAYYIMKSPVAMANYPESYCYFREGQNSILRALDAFAAEELEFNKALSNQLNSPPQG